MLTHSMDGFARRERTGQKWMDMLQRARLKLVETRDLNARSRYLTEDRLYENYMTDLGAARRYSQTTSEKVGESFDDKARAGESTYGVEFYGHEALWSYELPEAHGLEPRTNKHSQYFKIGGRVLRHEAESCGLCSSAGSGDAVAWSARQDSE